MDKNILRLLNESAYEDSEIEEYMSFATVDEEKLNRITNDIKLKIAKDALRESGIYVESILNEGEKIEKVIKGTDIDMLESSAMVNMMMPIPFMTGDGFSFNRLLFCTNERIIVIASNYYNNPLGVKSYHRKDIKKISIGKKVKRRFRLNNFLKDNISILKIFFMIFYSIPILFGIGVTGYVVKMFIEEFIINSEFVSIICARIIVLIFLLILIIRPKLITEVLVEIKDGTRYDLIIRNYDYKDIHSYLCKFWEMRGNSYDR
ncbi:hypothetical protein [Clostridium sp. 'White wine YQ']|uniref:hypothetical protein n=1 Tax=Clostridium sp. 'White wine YQ' TaxID=3027474 RepID=UPI0023657FA7|nr:hypothetical protein [Clostridium sp. 'White wine YQ']MDD7795012.1 hypothetical protein [Clostridium sp. 'White wine YQ']